MNLSLTCLKQVLVSVLFNIGQKMKIFILYIASCLFFLTPALLTGMSLSIAYYTNLVMGIVFTVIMSLLVITEILLTCRLKEETMISTYIRNTFWKIDNFNNLFLLTVFLISSGILGFLIGAAASGGMEINSSSPAIAASFWMVFFSSLFVEKDCGMRRKMP